MKTIAITVELQNKLKYVAIKDETRRATIFYKLDELSFGETEEMIENLKNEKMLQEISDIKSLKTGGLPGPGA